MTFAYPRLGGVDLGVVRLAGPGLGNLLFPWARAVVFARACGGRVLWPTWRQAKLGPLLRGERDLRHYHGLFSPTDAYVTGLRREVVRLTCRRVSESDAREQRASGRVVVFEGLEGLFEPLSGQNALVLRELLAIAAPGPRASWRNADRDAIAVHVRLGDLNPVTNTEALRRGGYSYRIPMSWYVHCIRELGKLLPSTRVLVYSDGSDEELRPLLALPRVDRALSNTALGDMLAMSASRALVGASSTFSMWASFLGEVPTIWFPGQRHQPLHASAQTEVELAQGEPLDTAFALSLDGPK